MHDMQSEILRGLERFARIAPLGSIRQRYQHASTQPCDRLTRRRLLHRWRSSLIAALSGFLLVLGLFGVAPASAATLRVLHNMNRNGKPDVAVDTCCAIGVVLNRTR